ncbi:hypothetical protein E4U42_003378 [Claviceps africana]|uniref:Uncharacterized protein n=1 Tax=Claviceps africana TaxID=83212 RepID=A0A8K0J9M4_9HYPO|nr:hypothetical protein E4U42_003378 [Claviceps africana]
MFESKPNNRSREPPPVLFLHPSAGASHVSVTSTTGPTAFMAGHISTSRREQSSLDHSTSVHRGSLPVPDVQRSGRPGSSRSTDNTDALWAEMQATLEKVELSASGGTHVFGSGHSQKLSELRSAQIGLAQAWARSEADEATVMGMRDKIASSGGGDLRNTLTSLTYSNGENGSDQVRRTRNGVNRTQNERIDPPESDLTGQSEMDIVLGRKRREANDKYFQRVNNGVIDVVAKLKDVTVAMHAVEEEGQHVWNEADAS